MKAKINLTILILFIFTGCGYKNNNLEKHTFNNLNKFDINQNFQTSTDSSQEIILKKPNKKTQRNKNTANPPIIKPKNIFEKYKIKTDKSNGNQKNISINVENIPIPEFIKLVFGQILKRDYSLSEEIEKNKKTITLKINKKVNEKEFFNIVKNILNSNNIKITKENNIYYFKRGTNEKIKKFSDYIYYGRNIPKNLNDNYVITLIIPFYYIDPADIEWMLKRFYLSADAYIVNKRGQNIMFITDKVKYLKQALNFISIMDVPTLRNKHSALIKLKYIDVNDFVAKLNELLPTAGIPIAHKLKQNGVLIKSIPELNSFLVIYDKKEWLNVINYWKNNLDVLDVNKEKPQIFIYRPKNRDAKELIKLIKPLFSKIDVKSPKKKKSTNTALQVIADETRNTLIIYTTPSKYKQIYKMLNKLDILPKQVLIQVTIAEITLKDSLQYGFEWFLQHKGNVNYSLGTLGNLGIGGGGLIGSVINSDKTFQSILNFLAQKNLINILSSPKLVVLDNQSANINVGTQVPVLTSSTKTQSAENTATQVTQSVQYRNTGIILTVKPVVHSNGALTLQITQTVSDPQPNNTSSISSPIILNRSLNTKVVLKSNQALLLGGLIKENRGRTVTKVPLLGDIPGFGNLFKTTSYSKEKTELIIIVKPVIISNTNEANQITNQFKNLLNKYDTN